MTGTTLLLDRAGRLPGRPAVSVWPRRLAVGLAVLATLARVPFLRTPLSPDEGGFLMVAGQWHAGTSLYGDYWVDRPPLLITLLTPVAHWADPGVGLHLIGAVAVLLTVLLAGRLAAMLTPEAPWACALGAATAAVFCDCAWFGASAEVDGELLAVPFVLASLAASLLAARTATARPTGAAGERSWAPVLWWAVAGAAALAGAAVKQDFVDGFIGVATVLGCLLLTGRHRIAAQAAAAAGAGAVLALAALLAWAAAHGTMPGPLWDATVRFRLRAGVVLSAEAPGTYGDRWRLLTTAFVLSGAPLVILAGLFPRRLVPGADAVRRRRPLDPRAGALDPRLLLVPLVAWELTAVALGGSYWLHYLIGLVPGLVVTSAVISRSGPHRTQLLVGVLAWAALTSVVLDVHTHGTTSGEAVDASVEDYLRTHATPGDTGVVAFGNPVLLQGAGLSSPYENLWSLPVKVRDPHLSRFTAVLESPRRPTWLLVAGSSVGSWGLDSTTAQRAADRYYEVRRVIGDWQVLHVRP